ncbi:PilN domain-containing protein [Methylobacter sp. S3L5C]|uniref:PilN domain-containing protein n=1 Tax=Methylobacter sp. S3L5C TaxID=2839024 RepID=UPI001FACEAB0|nr:PilN domain-containing protein [Methylobacter sp. S3L5C]UOA07543.1 PilN domain-containing protein [Methylobacter sp. S3L5C]
MTKINLLPWRKELFKKKQKEFFNAIVLSILAGFIILGMIHTYVERLNTYQEQRNQLLSNEIIVLNKKIIDISSIEEKKRKLLAKIDLIQKLQQSRPEIVHLFDEIPKMTPDGIFLTKFSQSGPELIFEGKSQSNARVSAFMRAIEVSPWLQTPGLTVIQSSDKMLPDKNDTEQLSDFTLHATQEKNNPITENKGIYEPIGN